MAPSWSSHVMLISNPMVIEHCLSAMVRGGASIAGLAVATLALAGCWTAPVASVQPKDEPRLIQGAIAVELLTSVAIVRSVDAAARSVVLFTPGDPAAVTYRVGREVRNLGAIKVGDAVQAAIAEELAVYVLRDGRLPAPGGVPQVITTDARVLFVDSSYRLLRLQFPNGRTETFKVNRHVRLDQMAVGDDVVVRPVEVVALRVRK